jgi:hypothetical protein
MSEVSNENDISTVDTNIKGGLFYTNLVKNAKAIKQSRAESLTEDLEFAYRNKIELITRSIREKKRILEDSLDLYPNNSTSLELAKDFKADEFVNKDLTVRVAIRNLTIELDIAKSAYEELVGKPVNV